MGSVEVGGTVTTGRHGSAGDRGPTVGGVPPRGGGVGAGPAAGVVVRGVVVGAGPAGGVVAPVVGAGAAGGGTGVGVGVGGARANGGSSPTIALGWMLRSWFLFPEASSCRVRMCHGAPDTWAAPSGGPPIALSQYADWARCPPQARRTAGPVVLNWTRKSPVLLPSGEPEWIGPAIESIVPPQMVNLRGAAE